MSGAISRALLIGINRYDTEYGGEANLRGCLNDVGLIRETLVDIFRCPAERIFSRTDDQATYPNLVDALDAWTTNLQSGERLFLYYSGHGVRIDDLSGQEEDAYDEAIVTHDFSRSRPLLDDILRFFMNRIPRGVTANVLLDCCHSGGLPRMSITPGGPYSQPRSVPPITRDDLDEEERHSLLEHKRRFESREFSGRYAALTACQADELAWESDYSGTPFGMMTAAVCNALGEIGPQATLRELRNYAIAWIEDSPHMQTPKFVGNAEFYERPLFD